MQLRTKLEIAGAAAGTLILGATLFAWVNAREVRIRAEASEAASNNALAVIAKHDADAKAQLDAFMKAQQAQMAALNKKFDQAKTAPDIASIVQQIMALQKPITFVTPPATPQNPNPQPVAQVPAEDAPQVKAYVQACEQCKLDLRTTKTQLTYEQQQRQSDLDKLDLANRDVKKWKDAAKGGGFFANLKRTAKWFGIGALAGAVALCGTGHCR